MSAEAARSIIPKRLPSRSFGANAPEKRAQQKVTEKVMARKGGKRTAYWGASRTPGLE